VALLRTGNVVEISIKCFSFQLHAVNKRVFMKNILAILVLMWTCSIFGQESIPATGGNATGSGGTVSYTIGQVVYTTNTGSEGSALQGVQQPYEISIETAIEQAKDIILVLTTYPNPTTDNLTLKIENYDSQNLSYYLFDVNGKLLENKKVTENETTISMTNLSSAIYFLKVIDNQEEIKIFKIIKN
jgi:hypothetical protein